MTRPIQRTRPARPGIYMAVAWSLIVVANTVAWLYVERHPYPLRGFGPHAAWVNAGYIALAYLALAYMAHRWGSVDHPRFHRRTHNPRYTYRNEGLWAAMLAAFCLASAAAVWLRGLVPYNAYIHAAIALPLAAGLVLLRYPTRKRHFKNVNANRPERIRSRNNPGRADEGLPRGPGKPPFVEQLDHPGIDYRHVIGMDDAKKEIERAVRLIEDPALARRHDVEPIKGILLYGPPGTGKTLFARATAGQFGKRFLNVRATDVVQAYVGETGQNIRWLFDYAATQAPCILFIDEFDAIAPDRSQTREDHVKSMVSALLEAMDGVVKHDHAPILLAATNHPEAIDPAIKREGRLDRKIHVGAPDQKTREQLVRFYLRKRRLAPDVDVKAFARRLEDWTPKQIESVVKTAFVNIMDEDPHAEHPRPVEMADLWAAYQAKVAEDRQRLQTEQANAPGRLF